MKNSMIILTAIIAAGSVFTSCTKKTDVKSASEVAKAQTEVVNFAPDPKPAGDGSYREVHIWNSKGISVPGQQFDVRVWMSNNATFKNYADFTKVAYMEDGNAGALYSYYDAYANHKGEGDAQGVCPNGWHMPNLDEWAWTVAMIKAEAGCDDNDGRCLVNALVKDGSEASGLNIEWEKGRGDSMGNNLTGFWFRDGALFISDWGTEWKSVDEVGKFTLLSVRCVKD